MNQSAESSVQRTDLVSPEQSEAFTLGRVRMLFWVVGLVSGAILTYTTRYYVNSDAIIYMEMGEMLFRGEWHGVVNLTFSPVFAFLLGIGQLVFGTDPMNELLVLRVVNFFSFAVSMVACDLVVRELTRAIAPGYHKERTPMAPALLTGLIYGFFLIAGLIFIRVRLSNPDMLILLWTCLGIYCLLKMRREPTRWVWFGALGVVCALGYMSKAFFFLYSPVLFVLAGLTCGTIGRAVPRVAVSVTVMVILSAPLIAALSAKKGGFTYGEGGRHIYALDVAGKGTPLYEPTPLMKDPDVFVFDPEHPGTRPRAYDVTYWTIGIKPDWRAGDHIPLALWNAWLIIEQNPWTAGIVVWFIVLAIVGSFSWGALIPPSPTWLFLLPGAWGTGLFCLIRMEPRYVAPFLFLLFVGGMVGLRLSAKETNQRRTFATAALVLGVFIGGLLVHTVIDQTYSGLFAGGTKGSFRDMYQRLVAVNDFLRQQGLQLGYAVAVIDEPPLYWARMAGLRVLGEVPDADAFLNAPSARRSRALDILQSEGIKAVIARDYRFGSLVSEGWRRVPDARSYYVRLLEESQRNRNR